MHDEKLREDLIQGTPTRRGNILNYSYECYLDPFGWFVSQINIPKEDLVYFRTTNNIDNEDETGIHYEIMRIIDFRLDWKTIYSDNGDGTVLINLLFNKDTDTPLTIEEYDKVYPEAIKYPTFHKKVEAVLRILAIKHLSALSSNVHQPTLFNSINVWNMDNLEEYTCEVIHKIISFVNSESHMRFREFTKHMRFHECGDKPIIDSFRGEYAFLSNFFPCTIQLSRAEDDLIFQNAEAAFQSFKVEDLETRKKFTTMNPTQAKKFGRRVKLRPDWENIKLMCMYQVIYRKFTQNPDLARKLLLTGDSILIEGNDWGDVFWGQVDGVGENHLGKILMRVRQELNKCIII